MGSSKFDSRLGSDSRSSKLGGPSMTVDLLKEAAMIASSVVCPRKVCAHRCACAKNYLNSAL